jgi:hypothetical protein
MQRTLTPEKRGRLILGIGANLLCKPMLSHLSVERLRPTARCQKAMLLSWLR